MSHTEIWHATAIKLLSYQCESRLLGHILQRDTNQIRPCVCNLLTFHLLAPSKTIRHRNQRASHKLHVFHRSLASHCRESTGKKPGTGIICKSPRNQYSLRDASRGHWPALSSSSKHKSWFYACEHFLGLPTENSKQQTDTIFFHSKVTLTHIIVCPEVCKKPPTLKNWI